MKDRPTLFTCLGDDKRRNVYYGKVGISELQPSYGKEFSFVPDPDIFSSSRYDPVPMSESSAWVGVLACERKAGVSAAGGAHSEWSSIRKKGKKESNFVEIGSAMTTTDLLQYLLEDEAMSPFEEKVRGSGSRKRGKSTNPAVL